MKSKKAIKKAFDELPPVFLGNSDELKAIFKKALKKEIKKNKKD